MKRRTCILMLGIALSAAAPVQKTPAVLPVTDGAHIYLNSTEWFSNLLKWLKQLDEMVDAQKLRKKLQSIDYLKEVQSISELAQLADDVLCMQSDYNFYMSVNSGYKCLRFLNFQTVSLNMQVNTDFLKKIITVEKYFSMNSEGRLSYLDQAKRALEASATSMREFSAASSVSLRNKINKRYMLSCYTSADLCNNRYN